MRRAFAMICLIAPILMPLVAVDTAFDQFSPCNPRVQRCK